MVKHFVIGLPALLLIASSGAWAQDVAPNVVAGGGAPPKEFAIIIGGDTVKPAATNDLAAEAQGPDLVLTWTGAGDDGMSGTPTAYTFWISTDPEFNTEEYRSGPAPQPAGTPLSMTLSGLQVGVPLYIVVWTTDNAGNDSNYSNVAEATIPLSADTLPPDIIDDLAPTQTGTSSVDLGWTPPSDPGGSGLGSYDLRWRPESAGPITPATWSDPATVSAVNEPDPTQPVAATETMTVGGLLSGTGYHVAIRAVDRAGNLGSLCPVEVRIRTSGLPPTIPVDAGDDGGSCAASASMSGHLGWILLGVAPVLAAGFRRNR